MPRPLKPSLNIVVSTGTSPALAPKKSTGSTGTSPALPSDRFANASKAVAQLTGRDAVRTPGQLGSDLSDVDEAAELPGRLATDLALHLPELVSLLSLTRQQKASRLVEFLVPYASKLAELSASAALPEAQRAQVEEKLLSPMSAAGLDQVVEVASGKTGTEIARELLSARTPEDARAVTEKMTFDAPTWASRPEATGASEVKRGEPSLQAQPSAIAPRPERERLNAARGSADEEQQSKDRPDRKLGKNMVWNVLHFLRGSEAAAPPEELKKQQELLTATGGIIVLVITVAMVIVLAFILAK